MSSYSPRKAGERTPMQTHCGKNGCIHTSPKRSKDQGIACAQRDINAKKYDPEVVNDADFCIHWRAGYMEVGKNAGLLED